MNRSIGMSGRTIRSTAFEKFTLAVVICGVLGGCIAGNAIPDPHEVFCMEVSRDVTRPQWESMLEPLSVTYDLDDVRGPSKGQYQEFTVVNFTLYRGTKNFLSINNVSDSAYYEIRMRLGDDTGATARMRREFMDIVRKKVNPNVVEVDVGFCDRPDDRTG